MTATFPILQNVPQLPSPTVGRLIRVFPRRTKATPDDELAYTGPPDLFAYADEVHISVAFTADKPIAERLADQWSHVAPVKVGGVAYEDDSLEFIPGRYIKPGYTITSRGCPRRCWFSVTGDTAVHTANGWETIDQLRVKLRGRQAHIEGDRSIVEYYVNERVSSPMGTAIATAFLDEGERPVYEVKTRNGLTLKGTAEHPLLCVVGESLVWKSISEIQAGDMVVIRTPSVVSGDYVPLGRPQLRAVSLRQSRYAHFTPSVLDEDLAWLLGYIIGDGCLPMDGRPAVHVCVVAQHKARLGRVLREKFGVDLRCYDHQKTKKIQHGWIHSRIVREFFVQILGVDPANKLAVPPCVLQSPQSVIESFLNGLWDADGYKFGRPSGYIATVSKPFANQIALLVLSTGSVPYIQTVKNEVIYKDGFCYRIGRRSLDVIPSERGIYRSKKSSLWYWRTAKGKERAGIERDTLRRSSLQHPLDREGWFYLRVASVAPAGIERVYDLTVPGEEAFIANGFVAHNCGVWKKWPEAHPLPIYDGWNILDDNLLACPRWHVEKVFAMLRQQKRRVGFTGGLEALSLEDYQVGLLADLKPRPNCFFAYDPGDAFETLESAARRMIAAGFTQRSHRLGCYVLIGYPKDTFTLATKRLTDIKRIGFTPRAMLWEPETASAERWRPVPEWHAFQRQWMRPKIIHARKPETEATR